MKSEYKTHFNPVKNIFEREILEEDVIAEITQMAAYCGIVLHRNRERIPRYMGEDGKWKKACTGKKSTPGIPDLDGYVSLRALHKQVAHAGAILPAVIYIEAKRPVGGRRRPEQEKFISDAQQEGAIACFATSWADVVVELARHKIFL